MSILVTGGAGYIGSHTCVELLNNKKDVIVIDDLSNSQMETVNNIYKITSRKIKFYDGNISDRAMLEKIFTENNIDSVIHFAGFKAVGESVKKPIEYYINNVYGSLVLFDMMKKYNVKSIVFSSSATVYGDQGKVPYTEDMELGVTTNPYGTSKLMIERILQDIYISDNTWNICILRYFNPVGAHESGLLGENPKGIPNNLMPYVTRVAKGELKELSIFGNDYNTYDGTGVRDYVHVVDLAVGHLKALEKINNENNGIFIYNLGNGKGVSVLELVQTFERINNLKIEYKFVGRRAGDLAEYYADITKARKELGFSPIKTIEDMCKDSWNFEKNNID